MASKAKSPKEVSRQPSQADKFKAAARELGTNDDPKAFDAKVRKIAKPKKG